ncbi:ATP-binding protein [Gimesia sp.]|uniref:ATP-binding protein n=1 Tax=Gimesia sp. TaxID=2024833 RepID=UPI000C381EF8|nr:ATP-binding protein [Gimesia sp.]MAX40086.1 hypothetical protein [Gimesia sp.]HAH48090.1 hypothetical protein [Planctomycetaceae bacterium]
MAFFSNFYSLRCWELRIGSHRVVFQRRYIGPARTFSIERRENILLVGNSGTGKTHLAVALGTAACGQAKRVRFYQVIELITQLMEG